MGHFNITRSAISWRSAASTSRRISCSSCAFDRKGSPILLRSCAIYTHALTYIHFTLTFCLGTAHVDAKLRLTLNVPLFLSFFLSFFTPFAIRFKSFFDEIYKCDLRGFFSLILSVFEAICQIL